MRKSVAVDKQDMLQQSSPQHLGIGMFPGNSWRLEKVLLSELISPDAMSVCSVNDLQGRQLLPRQLAASALPARKTIPAAGIATAATTNPQFLQLGFVITHISSIGLYFFSTRCEDWDGLVKRCVSHGCKQGLRLPLSQP